jgi:DNA repair exonuclease SbcCD ATPase subunit
MLEEKDINLCDLCKKIDMYKRKIENLNNKINMLNSEKSEEAKKLNNINSLYNQATKEMNKLERNLRENDLELANAKRENEINMNNLKDSTKKYNDDYNKLYNKLLNMQEEIDNLRKDNEYLINQNKNLANDNQSLCQNNDEMISEYRKTIDKLKKENDELKNTLKSRKYNISKNKNSNEDEIVIVNKETTYSKGLFGQPNEFNKYGLIKNKYEVKRNADVTSDEILKYHEIIQDLSNMILIYETFFFKGKVKPKNNHELFCYLLVQYINEKFKKIKLNTFMNLLYYTQGNKENRPRINYLRRNNSNLGSRYENNRNSYTERGNSRKRGYFSDRNGINNKYN